MRDETKFRRAAPGQDARAALEQLLDMLGEQVLSARLVYPDDDYAGRIYRCAHCNGLHGCCAPAVDLVDDYACPECGRAQVPVTEPGVPYSPTRTLFEHDPGCVNARPNREARRRARRR